MISLNNFSKWNNERECTENNGEWIGFYNGKFTFPDIETEEECSEISQELGLSNDVVWGREYPKSEIVFNRTADSCILLEDNPECIKAPWSRANHLGHSDQNNYFSTYRWALPNFHGLVYSQECVLRIRYNITTNDYHDEFDNEETRTYFPGKEANENPEVVYKGLNVQEGFIVLPKNYPIF